MGALVCMRYQQQAREALEAARLALKQGGVKSKMITVEIDPVSLI